MPGNNKTGPEGQGPMTGRGLGPCGAGRAFRKGFGRGRGFGWRANQEVELSKEEQKKILEAEKVEIEKRLKELENA